MRQDDSTPGTAARLVLVGLLLAMVAAAWLRPLEGAANAQVDAGLKRALISFASARALNAAISLAQGTEIAVQPAGVGVNLSVGQVLDPLNDLVERFADLMLMASIAFGIQKVLLEIGAHWAISAFLSLLAAVWALSFLGRGRAPPWLSRLLLVLLLTRFAVPLATIGSDAAFRHFMADDYAASQQVIEHTAGGAARLGPPASADAAGLVERFKGWLETQGVEWKARFEQLRQTVEQATTHIVKLMVIFVLQTLILPLLLVCGLYAVARGVLVPR